MSHPEETVEIIRDYLSGAEPKTAAAATSAH
jgi:hypothetical protein